MRKRLVKRRIKVAHNKYEMIPELTKEGKCRKCCPLLGIPIKPCRRMFRGYHHREDISTSERPFYIWKPRTVWRCPGSKCPWSHVVAPEPFTKSWEALKT